MRNRPYVVLAAGLLGLYVLAAEGVPPGRGPEREIRDVAPTLLDLLGEPVPAEMEGTSLLAPAPARA